MIVKNKFYLLQVASRISSSWLFKSSKFLALTTRSLSPAIVSSSDCLMLFPIPTATRCTPFFCVVRFHRITPLNQNISFDHFTLFNQENKREDTKAYLFIMLCSNIPRHNTSLSLRG